MSGVHMRNVPANTPRSGWWAPCMQTGMFYPFGWGPAQLTCWPHCGRLRYALWGCECQLKCALSTCHPLLHPVCKGSGLLYMQMDADVRRVDCKVALHEWYCCLSADDCDRHVVVIWLAWPSGEATWPNSWIKDSLCTAGASVRGCTVSSTFHTVRQRGKQCGAGSPRLLYFLGVKTGAEASRQSRTEPAGGWP